MAAEENVSAPMTDFERLKAGFVSGEFIDPSTRSASILDLACAIGSAIGVPDLAITDDSRRIRDMFGQPEHIVFVLVDGLGCQVMYLLSGGSFLPSSLTETVKTVFPSTTGVALTSLATCAWPVQHGVTGWHTHIPEMNGAASILQFARRSDNKPLHTAGLTTGQVLPVEAIYARAPIDCAFMLPDKIADSAFSRYFSGGRTRVGYGSFRNAIDLIVDRTRNAESPTFTYLYTDRIDSEIHSMGAGRAEIKGLLLEIDQLLDELRQRLDPSALLIVTADHGFRDATELLRHQIRATDPLMSFLRFPPSGDARVMYLHIHRGAAPMVREYFQRRFGDKFMVITIDEAEELGLFGPGPYCGPVKDRFGDLIAISAGADVIEYRPRGRNGRVTHEASQHSGLSPQEMLVPLMVIR